MVILEPRPAAPARHDVRRIDERTWLVRDPTLDRNDPRSVVACVTELDDHAFEVVWMHSPHLSIRFPTLGAAIQGIDRRGRPGTADRRPIPIPHRPPISPEGGHGA